MSPSWKTVLGPTDSFTLPAFSMAMMFKPNWPRRLTSTTVLPIILAGTASLEMLICSLSWTKSSMPVVSRRWASRMAMSCSG